MIPFTKGAYLYTCIVSRMAVHCTLRLKCDGTRVETRFRLSAKRTSPFKSAGASVQSTIGSRGVRISGSIAGYTMFRGSVKSTGYPLNSPVSPSFPLRYITVYHHISTGMYCRQHRISSRVLKLSYSDEPNRFRGLTNKWTISGTLYKLYNARS
jgi:hypothetical protein